MSLLFACAAAAEPNVPHIAQSASAYRATIEGITVELNAAQILSAIRRAEAAKRTPDLIRLYEQLIALNKDNFRAWLQLSITWREAEPHADKGLGAAYLAYRATQSSQDQLEALLLMSWFMRTRLERYKGDYDAAQDQIKKVDSYLSYLKSPDRAGDFVGLDPNDPVGNLRLLTQTRDNAVRDADQAIKQITQTVAGLDEVYREVAAKVPTVRADTLKEGDARSGLFDLVFSAGSDDFRDRDPTPVPQVSFRIEGLKVNACLEFTQELRSDNLSYKNFIEVGSEGGPVPTFAVEAKGRTLCISGLDPGQNYELKVLKDLPSKLGAKLKDTVTIARVRLPDLPQQVAFSGRSFILPTSGPGEVPLHITNLDSFDLELFRITDRTLHRQVALGHVGGTLPDGEYADLREHFAEPLWLGTIQLQNPKNNVPVRAFLQVRSILESRGEWLKSQIASNRTDEFVSPRVAVPVAGREQLRGTGRYFAGAPAFEAAAARAERDGDIRTPGIYALVTRDLADDKRRDRRDSKNKDDGYLVQWFVSTDIGLTFYEGDQKFTVVTRSLRSGGAKAKTKVELVSAGNRVLGSAETDPHGVATFPINITRGTQSNKLVAILAYQDDDFSFMPFTAERLDLSRLNVDGRPRTDGFNGFLTIDRGVYQPGETIHLLALIRNNDGVVPDSAPQATIRLETRDRTLVQRRLTPQDWTLGGALVPIEVPQNMRAGTARLTLSVGGGNESTIAETILQVGPVRPDRARLEFVDQRNWQVRKVGDTVSIEGRVRAQYLFAAKGTRQGAARDLKAEVVLKVAAAESPARECYDGFSFGRFDDKAVPVSQRHFVEYTDKDGNLNLRLSGISAPEGTRPSAVTVEVTLFDVSGPLASRSVTFPITDDRGWIGISRVPTLRSGSQSGKFNVGVDLISVTSDNKPLSGRSLDIRVERERDLYVWERRDDTWQHVRSVRHERVANSSIPADRLRASPPAEGSNCARPLQIQEIAQNLEVGRYVLTVSDPHTRRESAIRFQTGTATTSADQLEPNIFSLSSNKSSYLVNEPIEITAELPFDGEILVAFAEGDILRWVPGQVRNGTARISLQAPPEWVGKGVYALATVFRSGTDGTVVAGPGRAIGATHFQVKGEQAGFGVAIEKLGNASQGFIAPGDSLSFKACIADATGACSRNPPAVGYAAAFVVDEGLLSLTGHHDPVPDPERHFYGRKRFGLRIMDNYNRLLLKEGGDRAGRLALSNYTSARIVSIARGPLKLENGSAVFTIPKLDLQNGSASIFVVMWSKDYAAANSSNITVRSHVVADIDVPRFLHAGDRAILPLRLENIDFDHRDFDVKVSAAGAVSGVALFASGTQPGQVRSNAESRISLPQSDPKTIYLAVETTADARGSATLNLALEASGSPVPLAGHRYSWSLEIRQPALTSVDTVSFPLQRQSTNLGALVQGIVNEAYDADSVSITARFSDDTQSLLSSVGARKDRAPAILDHLVWRGLLLLYSKSAENAAERKQELLRILSQIQSLQGPDGSFASYRTVGEFSTSEFNKMGDPLATLKALDLLSLARDAGYDVADQALGAARHFVETFVEKKVLPRDDELKCSLVSAYAWLVLMRLRQVGREKIDHFERCQFERLPAQAAAAAVSAKYGLSEQARVILADFSDRNDADSLKDLSDVELAMIWAFLAEAGASAQSLNLVANALFAPDRKAALSEAALAWALRAGAQAPAPTGARLTVADLQVGGAPSGFLRQSQAGVVESAPIRYQRLRSAPISVGLRRNIAARGLLTIEGQITKPSAIKRVPAGALKRRFFRLDGEEINLGQASIEIGDRLVVVIEGSPDAVPTALDPDRGPSSTEDTGVPVLLAELLPSSFQVVSNDIFRQRDFKLQGALETLTALGDLRSVETDADRWVALIVPESRRDRPPGQSDTDPPPSATPGEVEFRQGYVVQLNMAGRFTFPALSIEPTTPPVRTLRAEQSTIEIKSPSIPAR